jgi:hypothetical protein
VDCVQVNPAFPRDPGIVVLVNCQLGGGADEGQPGFGLVLAKAFLFHQWAGPIGGITLEPEPD